MTELIKNSQICLLHATQRSGMKLKLINTLTLGRHIIASEAVTTGTKLEPLCHIAHSASDWCQLAEKLMVTDFTPDICSERNRLLAEVADNAANARKIIESINNYNVHP